MSFIHNKQFAEYFEKTIHVKTVEPSYQPVRTTKRIIKGWQAKVWRWFYKRMNNTSQQFGTVTHKEVAEGIIEKGWKIITYTPARHYRPSAEELFHLAAQGFQREIPQLSHKTQIREKDYRGQPMHFHHSQPMPFYNAALAQPQETITAIPMSTYSIESQQLVLQVQSDRHYGELDYYRFAVAYDALNDCLYIDYEGSTV